MKASGEKEQPVRLPEEELRKSRAGKLGCFPSEDLYEPEHEETRTENAPSRTRTGSGNKHDKRGE